jgi:TonB family protein
MRWSQRSAIGMLLGGASLLAQTNPPPAEPKVVPSDSQTADDGGGGTSKPTFSSQAIILSDTMGVDFKPYLDPLIEIVRQQWYRLIPESAATRKGKVVLEFGILKDGSVTGLRIAGSSGDIALDRPAYGSIIASNPFPRLPTDFQGSYLALRLICDYNLAPRNPLLFPLVEDVSRKHFENLLNDKQAQIDLEHDVAALTKLLDAGNLDSDDEAGARFSRALAYTDLDFLRRRGGLSPDTSAAQLALSDLDRIIAGNSDIPEWGITIPDVEYYAGTIAWRELRSDVRAYSYWQRCADRGHGGCLLGLAGGYTVGWGKVPPDQAKALDLDLKAFATGNHYVCAGANAAANIAKLIYFMGASHPEDNDPVSWMHKSYALLDPIEARPNGMDACSGSVARIDEFLYRLSRGERRKDLLIEAAKHRGNEANTSSALVDYFSGSINVNAFKATVESNKSDAFRCSAYFRAMWYASLTGPTDLADKFYEQLLKFDHLTCQSSLLFAQKIHARGIQIPTAPLSTSRQSPSGPSDLATEALSLYRVGRFDDGAQRYQQLLQTQPKSAEAYAGLARVYLKQKKVQLARDTISKGLAVADSPPIHVALGEVLFREGKLTEAEQEWLSVINSGHADARAHLGLARLSIASTQYKQAKTEIDEAHRLDPDDPDIQFYWIRSQGLGAGLRDSNHDCRLATDLVPTEADLILLSGDRPDQIRGYGLPVSVNGQSSKLLLDTGAHGILIDRKIARRASLTKVSDTSVGGFGDQRKSAGYFATADIVKIGGLEFHDCNVTVVDKGSILGEDGLIGSDVFQDFMIDLDFPAKKLRLGRLPKLQDDDYDPEGHRISAGVAGPVDVAASANGMLRYNSVAKRPLAQFSFAFVPAFRFGHLLLIETEVGDSIGKRLFAIDTGAARNLFSVSTAQEIAKVQENSRLAIKGLSGSVNKVYDAEKTALHFGHVQQYADKETALSLAAMSDEIGTEVSGVLGVLNLRYLDVIIDYSDGLVGFDFSTDPAASVHP